MSSGQVIRTCGFSLAASLFTVGCFTKKSEEVAESTAAPPPAAYPAGESSSSDGAYAAPAPDAPASTAYSPAPSPRSSEPEPFSLRDNEQLVAHRIESGDTLGVIAKKYGTTVSRIKSANGMSSDTIYAGKTIQVPSTGLPSFAANSPAQTTAPAPSSAPVSAAPASATSYRSPSAGASASGGYTGTDGSTGAYPRIESAAPPAPATQPGSAFPTPSFGGSSIQFSD